MRLRLYFLAQSDSTSDSSAVPDLHALFKMVLSFHSVWFDILHVHLVVFESGGEAVSLFQSFTMMASRDWAVVSDSSRYSLTRLSDCVLSVSFVPTTSSGRYGGAVCCSLSPCCLVLDRDVNVSRLHPTPRRLLPGRDNFLPVGLLVQVYRVRFHYIFVCWNQSNRKLSSKNRDY